MKTSRSRRRRGFTLIEVLLVLVILVIIMGMAAGTYLNRMKKANIDAARAQVGLFKTPLEMFNIDMEFYPTNNEGLQALCYAPADLPNPEKWYGPYLDKDIPLDPWGRLYNYTSPGKYNSNTFDVWSVGPDGIDGTPDDIGNWSQ